MALLAFCPRATIRPATIACLVSILTFGLSPQPKTACFAVDFPAIYNSESDKTVTPLAADQAAATLQMPPGFSANVFAAEPDVQNPIAMCWDARGRMWVAENYTYAEREQRFDLELRDRVVILEDTDGDGTAERRSVFTDQVQMLTSIAVGRGGVWLMCPPNLLFVPDADRDDRPDAPPTVVLDGFEVAEENYHNFANGLKWGPDGWLYGRCGGSCPGRIGRPGAPSEQRVALEGGIWRYNIDSGVYESLTHGTTNPWGHDWNAEGDGFFVNTVNGHLWQIIPGAHYDRPFTLDPNPYVYETIQTHADHWHFDTDGSWTASRDGAANEHGGGHAHIGALIYRDDKLPPEFRGSLLTWNMHGRRCNVDSLRREGSGYVGTHAMDTFVSADPFFRPMELSVGPDGAIYALDWSDAGECHEHTGVHRTSGRVYRISYGAPGGRPSRPRGYATLSGERDLYAASDLDLLSLRSLSQWHDEAATRELIDRSYAASRGGRPVDVACILAAREQLRAGGPNAWKAMTLLHAMRQLSREEVEQIWLSHRGKPAASDANLAAWAVRLLTDDLPIDDTMGPVALTADEARRVVEAADATLELLVSNTDHPPSVDLALASTIQRLPVRLRGKLAQQLVADASNAEDHNLPLLVWYGLIPYVDAYPGEAAELAIGSQWPKTRRFIARRIGELIDHSPEAVDALVLAIDQKSDDELRSDLLAGLSDGLRGRQRAPMPAGWPDLASHAAHWQSPELSQAVRDLSVVFGDGRALAEVRKVVLDEQADSNLRRTSLIALIAAGREDLRDILLPLLSDARLNAVAVTGLARHDDSEVAKAIIDNYRRFRSPERAGVISLLASRPTFATALIEAVEQARIPVDHITAYDARQIRALDDEALNVRLSQVWGEVNDSPQAKRDLIIEYKQALSADRLAAADLTQGRMLFERQCSQCHRMYGAGAAIGPELTGANRGNIDYLLENIVDPSAVVSRDYRMSVVQTDDDRVLTGLIVEQNDRTLTLQTPTERMVLDKTEVAAIKQTGLSPMPDGILATLSADQVRDLIGYMMHPAQVFLPSQ